LSNINFKDFLEIEERTQLTYGGGIYGGGGWAVTVTFEGPWGVAVEG
jgi:hypothetical protein